MGPLEGSGIVWDGDSDVRTQNIFAFVDPTNLSDPTEVTLLTQPNLGVGVSLSGDDSVDILLRLLITADIQSLSDTQRENLPSSWRTLAAATSDLNLNGDFEEVDTFEPSNNANVRVVAMSVDFQVTGNGSFALNATQQAELSSILTNFSQLGFYVGIMGEIRNDSMAEGSRITFTTTSVTTPPTPQPVPEPSTMLLLGTGAMALVARRFRRA